MAEPLYVPRAGSFRHHLLSVAGAEPQSAYELFERLEERYGLYDGDMHTARQAAIALASAGCLRRVARSRGRYPTLYVLTEQGQAALDSLDTHKGAAHG